MSQQTVTEQAIVFIGHLWPEPDSSAAGYRTLALIQTFLKFSNHVTFISAAQANEYSSDLTTLGVSCQQIKLNDSDFEKLISAIEPSIVIYDRFMTEEQYAWRVEKVCPKALKILDTCDLHFLRRARQKSLIKTRQLTASNHLSEINHLDLQSEDAIREIAAILRCDLSLIISSFEMQLLTQKFNISSEILVYLPFMLDSITKPKHNNFEQRKHFIQIGNFLHPPNWDAVLWCQSKIWPFIRQQLPQAECHVYGAYMPDKAKQLHQPKNGFYIKGRAENLPKLMQEYKLNLAPLRFGAGIKGKIADGFLSGLPCISTSIGAEGMSGGLAWGGKISDKETEFIKNSISLYTRESKWKIAQENGYRCINEVHNKEILELNLIKSVAHCFNHLDSHRKLNFIGTMLNYHLHQRTKYLSRWIEEKNKSNFLTES